MINYFQVHRWKVFAIMFSDILLDNLCKSQIKCLCVYNIVTCIRIHNKRKSKKEPESSAELSPESVLRPHRMWDDLLP